MADYPIVDASSEDDDYAVVASSEDAVVLGRDDVSDFNPDNILPLPENKLAKIRAWLQPTEYEGDESEFKKHLTAHLDGTGDWLLSSREYATWHSGRENGLLWIRGNYRPHHLSHKPGLTKPHRHSRIGQVGVRRYLGPSTPPGERPGPVLLLQANYRCQSSTGLCSA